MICSEKFDEAFIHIHVSVTLWSQNKHGVRTSELWGSSKVVHRPIDVRIPSAKSIFDTTQIIARMKIGY